MTVSVLFVRGCGRIEGIAKSERERTPMGLALWLIDLAQRCTH